jgi:hypothetical protein
MSRRGSPPSQKEPGCVFAKLLRPIGLCVALTVPALIVRFRSPVIGLLLFGMAVVAASFVLASANVGYEGGSLLIRPRRG